MRQEYNRAMDRIHMSDECAKKILEQASSVGRRGGSVMKYKSIMQKTVTAVAIAATLTAGAFAADAGGIRSQVVMWVNGQQQNVEVEKVSENEYRFTTEDGEASYAGGVTIGENGEEQPLDAEDLQDSLAINVEEADDGTWTLYYYDQTIDITEDMKDGGYSAVLEHDGVKDKVEVAKDGSMSVETLS